MELNFEQEIFPDSNVTLKLPPECAGQRVRLKVEIEIMDPNSSECIAARLEKRRKQIQMLQETMGALADTDFGVDD